ncbi:acetyl-CoA hydrolase/transferase C-terminal domain-containing protein [Paenarthrobacter sp. NPDC089316]|uniref:acetyl-CoA hydrolase/transferase family protein n=1 Tax=unclassified Paenarthrobacter TaxID=2634190 RepID=UPI003428CC22
MDIRKFLQPGDTVVVGQGAAEPTTLLEELGRACETIDGLSAICGYSLSDAWQKMPPGRLKIKSYAGHGAFRKIKSADVDILPEHYSRLEGHIASGRIPVDVVMLQVGPLDEEGCYDLGLTVDYAVVAAEHARVVLVEVNENMPRTRSTRRLPASRVTAAMTSRRDLPTSPARQANDVEERVAANVAGLIPDRSVIQLGVGALADAVANQLHDRRGLRVRSGLAGDWLKDLCEAGAVDEQPGSIVIGLALGSDHFYSFIHETDRVEFAPIDVQTTMTGSELRMPYFSINSAIEVDLLGQANSEIVGERYVGAVGGQVDFCRTAQRSGNGMAIIALASTSRDGNSRIAASFDQGIVTASKSDVDVVVTEWGVADLRACTFRERARRLISIAHPNYREYLAANARNW